LKKSKELKRREAEARQKRWEDLSPDQQIAHLDKNNYGAKKQRHKIAKAIATKK